MPKLSEMKVEVLERPFVGHMGGDLFHIINRRATGRHERKFTVSKCGIRTRWSRRQKRTSWPNAYGRGPCFRCGGADDYENLWLAAEEWRKLRDMEQELERAVRKAERNWAGLYEQIEDRIEEAAIDTAFVDVVLDDQQVLINAKRLQYLTAFERFVKLGLTGKQATEAIDEALEMGADPLFMSMALKMSMAMEQVLPRAKSG